MLNARGGVEGDLTVTVVEPGNGQAHTPVFDEDRGFYVAVGGGAAQQGLDHMKKVWVSIRSVGSTNYLERRASQSVRRTLSRANNALRP